MTLNGKIALVADTHVSLRKNSEWEAQRFRTLIDSLATSEASTVIFLGDLFDKARPSIEELNLVLVGIAKLNKQVILVPGNHEALSKTVSLFHKIDFGCIVIDNTEISYGEHTLRVVGWHNLHEIKDHTADALISHYRSTYGPHIIEEIDTSLFINNYKRAWLGDIHAKLNVKEHWSYVGQPYNSHYERKVEPTGYIILNEDLSYEDVTLDIGRKIAIYCDSVEEFRKLNFDPQHLYRVSVSDSLKNLDDLSEVPHNVQLSKFLSTNDEVKIKVVAEQVPLIDDLHSRISAVQELSKERQVYLRGMLKELL